MLTTSHHARQSLHYLLDQAFLFYTHHLRIFTSITACCLLPIALILALGEAFLHTAAVPLLLLAPIAFGLTIGVLTCLTLDLQRRQSFIPIIYPSALRRAFDLVITIGSEYLLIFGPTLLFGGCMWTVLLEDNSESAGAAFFILLFPLFLIALLTIPVVAFWFFLALPVLLHEGCDAPTALGRSKTLTQSAPTRVFLIAGMILLVYLGTQVPALCLSRMIGMPAWVTEIAILLGLLIALPFHAVHATYLYHDLVRADHTLPK